MLIRSQIFLVVHLGNGLYVSKSISKILEIDYVVVDLPNHVQQNLSALEINSLSRPSQKVSYSLSDPRKREESTSLLDH